MGGRTQNPTTGVVFIVFYGIFNTIKHFLGPLGQFGRKDKNEKLDNGHMQNLCVECSHKIYNA